MCTTPMPPGIPATTAGAGTWTPMSGSLIGCPRGVVGGTGNSAVDDATVVGTV
eukprot:CAMPEP_0179140158 /NCGR_PEP_ID=MMETSP0796-20121207/67090_1 /TAXON_ID=73915 /ORGANISM="Pyrodinium bahamense, Strain pbaha01" /LENGTH=52 /DNA_ID=CAMNT_0020839669 /DNA_START=35 /DNA_END=193 /DNA_ORIENTATION=+